MNNSQHRKGLLPTGNYYCTIRQSYPAHENPDMEGDDLVIVWTVDSGDQKWRNLKKTYDIGSDLDMWKLQKMADRLNFEAYEPDHPEFYEQWVGLRGKLNVTVDLGKDSRFKKNVILEYSLPEQPPEIDVTKPKDNSHFEGNKERQLPI